MNDANKPLPAVNRELLDVLVDGELPEPERRDLLLKLEQAPGGWRACALAFLESQSLKQTCGAIAREQNTAAAQGRTDENTHGLPSPRVATRRLFGGLLHGGLTALTMAATFLVALGLGLMLRGWWGDSGPASGVGQFVSSPPGGETRGLPFPSDSTRQIAMRATPRPWGTVRVSLPGANGQAGESISVPVTESDRADESWFRPAPDAVPAEVRAALERMGYQIRQQRELLPFPMQDGSRLVLPVDQVEFHRVSRPAY
jgi:hypothetical protein